MTCSSEFCPISHELGKEDKGQPTKEFTPRGRAPYGTGTGTGSGPRGQLRVQGPAAPLSPAAPVPPHCPASPGEPGWLLTLTIQRPCKPFTKKSLNIKWKIQEGQLNSSWIFNNREDGKNNQINYLFQIITPFYL